MADEAPAVYRNARIEERFAQIEHAQHQMWCAMQALSSQLDAVVMLIRASAERLPGESPNDGPHRERRKAN